MAPTTAELAREVINSIATDDIDSAKSKFHDFLLQKTKEKIGTSTPDSPVDDVDEFVDDSDVTDDDGGDIEEIDIDPDAFLER